MISSVTSFATETSIRFVLLLAEIPTSSVVFTGMISFVPVNVSEPSASSAVPSVNVRDFAVFGRANFASRVIGAFTSMM